MVLYAGTTARTGGDPTYNSVALTQCQSRQGVTETSVEMWYMLSPPVGSALTVNVPNGNGVTMWVYVASGNAASGNLIALDASGVTATTGSSPTVSVTTLTAGALIFAVVATGDNGFAPTARTGTSLYEEDIAAYGGAGQYYVKADTGVQAMSWTETTSDDYGAIAVAFKEVVPTYKDFSGTSALASSTADADLGKYNPFAGYAAIDSDTSPTIDSYPLTNVLDYDLLYNADMARRESQSFTGNGKSVYSIKLWARKYGSPTGSAYCYIYDHSGTYGTSSIPTGSALATSNAVNVANIPLTMGLVEFTFSTPYPTVDGTKYVFVIEYSGGDADNCFIFYVDSASPTHSGNRAWYNDSITTWVPESTVDIFFYVKAAPALSTSSLTYEEFAGTSALASATADADLLKYSNFAGTAALASATADADLLKYSNYAGTSALASTSPDADLLKYSNYVGTSALQTDCPDCDLNDGAPATYKDYAGTSAIASATADADLNKYSNFAGTAALASAAADADLLKYSNFAGSSALATSTADADLLKYANYTGTAAGATNTPDADINRYGNFAGASGLVSSTADADLLRYGNFVGLAEILSLLPDCDLTLSGGAANYQDYAGTAALVLATADAHIYFMPPDNIYVDAAMQAYSITPIIKTYSVETELTAYSVRVN